MADPGNRLSVAVRMERQVERGGELMAETFTWELPELGTTEPHTFGDLNCQACCHDTPPARCDECGGMEHSNIDDVMPDGEMGHSRRCDRPCGCAYCPEQHEEASAQ